MAQACRALNLSDEKPCENEATHADGLFCGYHARQCMGMYLGYKKRNAQLNTLDADPPAYLAKSRTPLRNETFAAVKDEKTINELYQYLFKKHNLLDRVIRARRLHHAHFYSQTLDYGHKQYLDRLVNDKSSVVLGLEKLQRRTAEVLYEQQKWFSWVRQRQDNEEETRDNESKKVKKEALLFKRHMKIVNARHEKRKRLEEQKKQDAILEKAYEERLKQADEDVIEFDPIEDTIEDEREDYVDLMRRLMWLTAASQGPDDADEATTSSGSDKPPKAEASGKENVHPKAETPVKTNATSSALTRNAKKRQKAKAKAEAREEEEMTPKVEVNENREQMRDRLLHDQAFDAGEGMRGPNIAGTMEKPLASLGKIPGMPADEVEQILDDITEIRQLLLCRLLLSQAALLPAALRANSVEEFLADPEITTADLRDLCLHVEQPALQEIRDACADFARGDAEDSDDDGNGEGAEDEQDAFDRSMSSKKTSGITGMLHRTALPDKWNSKREALNEIRKQSGQTVSKRDDLQSAIDFGDLDDEGKFRNKNIRVRVCGKTIWNYPSENAMARGGWLHYSIIAKGTRFEDAINLCRNWQEFWDLNVLSLFQYFPSTTWGQWERNQTTRQLLQLGLIPYSEFTVANEYTKSRQQRGRGRGQTQHAAFESKNFICGYMKRNDPISRRFVQYVSMMSNHVCIVVRDGKTGRILIKPPKEHLWLVRKKAGFGRASRNEWDVVAEVGEDMFEQLSEYKKYGSYAFGFNEYYDITIWDLEPGLSFGYLYDTIHTALTKAHRVCNGRDLYNAAAPVLKTLHRDKTTGRARDAKPGESSIYDDLHSGNFRVLSGDALKGSESFSENFPKEFFYDEPDAAEDLVLFPEERQGKVTTAIKGFDDPITLAIESEPDIKRFYYELDTDDDPDDFKDIEGPNKGKTPAKMLTAKGEPEEKEEDEDQEEKSELSMPPDDVPPCPDPENPDCMCEECIWYDEHPDEDRDEHGLPEAGTAAENLEMMTLMEVVAEKDPNDEYDMRNQYIGFLEREASKAFRQQWHEADLTGSKERWRAMSDLLKQARDLQRPFSVPSIIEILKLELWLEYYKSEHRLVWRDMHDALTLAALNFGSSAQYRELCSKLSHEQLALVKELTNNAKKAEGEPYSRSPNGHDTRPDTFWDDGWRQIKDNDRRTPPAWDLFARPVTAAWFRAGMIGPAYQSDATGDVYVIKEEGKDQADVFIDYRDVPPATTPVNTEFRNIDLVAEASAYTAKHTGSRFALLRVWSHSHFWPLQIAGHNREMMAFLDTKGRCWHSRFIPKDMPLSDFSMQVTVGERTSRFKKQFKDRVVFKRDMALVLGESEEDLRWNTAAVIFALTTRPWKFEVDLSKSFINVDLGFLQGLDRKWVD